MAISTYAELQAAIADFLNRDDLTSVIPTFISLAEAQMARDIRHWRQEKRVVTTVDEQYENLPSDWLSMISLRLTDGGRLSIISSAEMQDRQERSQSTGKPMHYRITSDQIEFYPAPSEGYGLTMQYYAKVPALSSVQTDNWILQEAPDVYLYGALVHASPYLSDDNRTQVWAAFYRAGVEALNRDSMSARASGPLRMGVPR